MGFLTCYPKHTHIFIWPSIMSVSQVHDTAARWHNYKRLSFPIITSGYCHNMTVQVVIVILTLVMLNKLRCHSQSDCLIQAVDTSSHSKWQTVHIQISWLLQKPADLDLHCLQRKVMSRFSRTRFKYQQRQITCNSLFFRSLM